VSGVCCARGEVLSIVRGWVAQGKMGGDRKDGGKKKRPSWFFTN